MLDTQILKQTLHACGLHVDVRAYIVLSVHVPLACCRDDVTAVIDTEGVP